MLKHFLMGMLCCWYMHASAQDIFMANLVKISFFSEARLENIEAVSAKGSQALINNATHEMVFKVPITSFVFEHKLMQEHFNENYMESDKYPYSILKGKIVENVDLSKEGKYNVTVEGSLEMHGITKQRKFNGTIVNQGGKLLLDCIFMLPVADHDIKIPNDKLSNISQTIKVTVHAEFIHK